ncbi:hypothetical protein [Ramlibacter humi]|uniref:Uncharacterized protein n=1 Tax=Ramlibacter humi TaxID=2530451 RepID=A0A4Z0BBP6_9BURK|nr:hypothetical protein [Ramlibacter humi]TFY96586.1 hypothetical protein EZ216_20245 [Ramlibacter humi]
MDILGLIRAGRKAAFAPSTNTQLMSADERQALRREMLYESIRASFTAHGFYPEHYRFSVVPVDRRGHAHIVTVTLCARHAAEGFGPNGLLARLAEHIVQSARTTFGLQVNNVYWCVAHDMPDFLNRKPDNRLNIPQGGRQHTEARAIHD